MECELASRSSVQTEFINGVCNLYSSHSCQLYLHSVSLAFFHVPLKKIIFLQRSGGRLLSHLKTGYGKTRKWILQIEQCPLTVGLYLEKGLLKTQNDLRSFMDSKVLVLIIEGHSASEHAPEVWWPVNPRRVMSLWNKEHLDTGNHRGGCDWKRVVTSQGELGRGIEYPDLESWGALAQQTSGLWTSRVYTQGKLISIALNHSVLGPFC